MWKTWSETVGSHVLLTVRGRVLPVSPVFVLNKAYVVFSGNKVG